MTKCPAVGTACWVRASQTNFSVQGLERGSQGTLSICRHATPGQTPFVVGFGALECCILLVQVPQGFRGRLAEFRYPEPAIVVSKTFRLIPPVNAKAPHDSDGWGKRLRIG